MTIQTPCAKKLWFQKLARLYVKRRLKKQFSDIRVLGSAALQTALETGPVIIACNHVAWWDALLLVQLDASLGTDAYCLMDARSLRELPFFRSLGAIALNRENKFQSLRDMLASLQMIRKPGQALFIFPQGKQTPAHFPLHFFTGTSFLAKRSGLPVYPLGLRYDFAEGPRQVVHLALGSPLKWQTDSTRDGFTSQLERGVQDQLTRIDAHLIEPESTSLSLLDRPLGHDRLERVPLLATSLMRSERKNQ